MESDTELSWAPDAHLRAAALLRSAANDLKRDNAAAEADLGLPAGTFAEYVSGRRPLDWALVERAATVWPLNERDLLPVHNDCPDGIRVFRVKDSVASSRVIERGGTPYYEYRDTAMSRLSSYRPEWIRMLCTVADDEPDNPAVRWNEGHLLYQFTYFVGPVNYYYRWAGQSRCVPMDTGDSVWGVPFAPHTFTARSADEPAHILALTYGGDLLGDAQRELSALGPAVAGQLALRATEPAGLLRSCLAARMMTVEELAGRAGMPASRVARLVDGTESPALDELAALAEVLRVGLRDLLPPDRAARDGVAIRRRAEARRWTWPGDGDPIYRVTELAGDPQHPHTTALEVEVPPEAGPRLSTYQHQYLYVLDGVLRLAWEHEERACSEELAAGDSAYVQPAVRMALAGPATVLLLRIGGAVTNDVRFALGAMAAGGIERYLAEDRLWYRPRPAMTTGEKESDA